MNFDPALRKTPKTVAEAIEISSKQNPGCTECTYAVNTLKQSEGGMWRASVTSHTSHLTRGIRDTDCCGLMLYEGLDRVTSVEDVKYILWEVGQRRAGVCIFTCAGGQEERKKILEAILTEVQTFYNPNSGNDVTIFRGDSIEPKDDRDDGDGYCCEECDGPRD